MSEKEKGTSSHEVVTHESDPNLGSEISSRLETEKHWFAVNTKKDFENKVTATEKTVEELMQRLQWIYESLDKSKNDLKEKENDIKLILQEREKLLLR
jgi:peptidoglycan hydrolase CwlO-like protein